jgi:hypothetical protein
MGTNGPLGHWTIMIKSSNGHTSNSSNGHTSNNSNVVSRMETNIVVLDSNVLFRNCLLNSPRYL